MFCQTIVHNILWSVETNVVHSGHNSKRYLVQKQDYLSPKEHRTPMLLHKMDIGHNIIFKMGWGTFCVHQGHRNGGY